MIFEVENWLWNSDFGTFWHLPIASILKTPQPVLPYLAVSKLLLLLIPDEELLEMVREVSEDKMYDTIEFNEYLQMMSKQQKKGLTQDILKDAFRHSIIDVLWGQLIKPVQVFSTSEFHEYWGAFLNH